MYECKCHGLGKGESVVGCVWVGDSVDWLKEIETSGKRLIKSVILDLHISFSPGAGSLQRIMRSSAYFLPESTESTE